MKYALPALLLFAAASPVFAQSVPKLDYRQTCANTPEVGMDKKATVQSCLKDEAEAEKQLPSVWKKATAKARNDCLAETTQGGLPSYVELITCLEGVTTTKSK
ncbi:MAG TPA: hypothetical protein PKA55_06305 [Rhodoblastus sp.]|nr:hypothetical protein [Rhodoblastus sp.]